jgi:hypothetical protein
MRKKDETPVGPNVERKQRVNELKDLLQQLTVRRDAIQEWLLHNVKAADFMDRLKEYHELCTRVASTRTRKDNLRDGLPEMGYELPAKVMARHNASTKY